MMKIYLSGPMRGYPESNYPLFNPIAGELRNSGAEVYNPAEYPHDGPADSFPIRQAFAAYCKFICLEADAIVLLPGWEASKGVSAELALAKNCGLQIFELRAPDPLAAARSLRAHFVEDGEEAGSRGGRRLTCAEGGIEGKLANRCE